jgi:hydrogenase nickel incorporation protein HypA/HybF
MHERDVSERILQVVLQHATQAGAGRVTDVHIVIGELSDVSPDTVSAFWDQVSRGTAAEGSRLHIERAPTEIRCWACGLEYTPTVAAAYCPSCLSGVDRKALEHDIRMTAIDVEEASAPAGTPGAT